MGITSSFPVTCYSSLVTIHESRILQAVVAFLAFGAEDDRS